MVLLFLSIVYNTSFCGIHGKGTPVVSSLLHILGGALAFLLGYSYFAANSCSANIAAIAFGVFIAAGHLIQEIQDRDNDSMHNTRTLALWLGSKTVFFIAMSFFLISHLMIQYLVETGYFPAITWLNILALFAVIVLGGMCFIKMTERNLFLFRMRYRLVYAVFGLVIFIEIIT
jgi:4-hydroxybenzoate polyprenyltransferase